MIGAFGEDTSRVEVVVRSYYYFKKSTRTSILASLHPVHARLGLPVLSVISGLSHALVGC